MITDQQFEEIDGFCLVAESKDESARDLFESNIILIWQMDGFSRLNGLNAYLEMSRYGEPSDEELFKAFEFYGYPNEIGDLIEEARSLFEKEKGEQEWAEGEIYNSSKDFDSLERKIFQLLEESMSKIWRKLRDAGKI